MNSFEANRTKVFIFLKMTILTMVTKFPYIWHQGLPRNQLPFTSLIWITLEEKASEKNHANSCQLMQRARIIVKLIVKSNTFLKVNLDPGKFSLESWHHQNRPNPETHPSAVPKEITWNFVVRMCSRNFQARIPRV